MKNKTMLSVSLAALMLATTAVPAVADSGSSAVSGIIPVYVNGERVEFDTDPEIVSDRTFVPMRAIFEALGADVSWSNSRREAVAIMGANEVVLKIGSRIGIHGTEVDELDAAPYIKEERTMVPLRYLSESLGYEVQWNNPERSVYISAGSDKKDLPDENSDSNTKVNTAEAESILGNATELTYDYVTNRYSRYNQSLRSLRQSYKSAAQAVDDYYSATEFNDSSVVDQQKRALKLTRNWLEKQISLAELQGSYTITNSMDSISQKLVEIEQQKDTVAYAKKSLSYTQAKYNAGAAGSSELTTAENKVKTEELKLSSFETELEGLYIALYGSLELDQGNYSEPEFNIDYEPIGDVDMLTRYNVAVGEDPYIWYAENYESNAEFNVKTYEWNMQQQSYSLTKLDLQRASLNISMIKANLKSEMYTRYNNILKIEDQIAQLEDSLETLRNGIDTARASYEAGAMSRQKMEDTLQSESTIRYNILKLKIAHEQAKAIFDTPYLAPTYMVSGQ